MRVLKIGVFVIAALAMVSMDSAHKYYLSNTQIEYVQEKQSVQIISRLFIDDFENVLQERYDENLIMDNKEDKMVDVFVERYLLEKFRIKIDGEEQTINFLGKTIETGIVKCYLEITGVDDINAFEVTNQALFDLFIEQQNIVKLNIKDKKKSFILTERKDTTVLKFN